MQLNLFEGIAEQLRQNLNPKDADVAVTPDGTIEIVPASDSFSRSIEVRVRSGADLGVSFIVPTKRGSPFEQVFTGPAGETDPVVREAVAFVCDLTAERVVLAWDSRPLRGGRRFVTASDVCSAIRRDFAWVVSWRGIRDWSAPAA